MIYWKIENNVHGFWVDRPLGDLVEANSAYAALRKSAEIAPLALDALYRVSEVPRTQPTIFKYQAPDPLSGWVVN